MNNGSCISLVQNDSLVIFKLQIDETIKLEYKKHKWTDINMGIIDK